MRMDASLQSNSFSLCGRAPPANNDPSRGFGGAGSRLGG